MIYQGDRDMDALVQVVESSLYVPRLNLELAHGIAVHSSQGDEFDYVCVIVPRYTSFVTKEILYTALTRPKKHLYIMSTVDIMKKCVKNKRKSRQTTLGMMLRGEV
jgi:exodeoxyribonuclease V alpha subunit